ncbi:unnamed protein product [Closterium sp. NIES-64]|nr:unnamed protein product [Closterium sp. NIES-64]
MAGQLTFRLSTGDAVPAAASAEAKAASTEAAGAAAADGGGAGGRMPAGEADSDKTADPTDGANQAEEGTPRGDGGEGGGGGGGHTMIGGSIVGDVLYSIATGEEEGRSRARILAFAAKRYQTAVERNPRDYDALDNWALVLQESGVRTSLYQTAVERNPCDYDALYNWALVLQESADNSGPEAGHNHMAHTHTYISHSLPAPPLHRYQTAVERNPRDYDALYNWALVLQESADNSGPEAGLQGKDALLEEACRKYQAASVLCGTLHEVRGGEGWEADRGVQQLERAVQLNWDSPQALNNWGLALQKKAKTKYERAVQLNWDSPQALNNWGLALQELSTIVPAKDKRKVVRKAINKEMSTIVPAKDKRKVVRKAINKARGKCKVMCKAINKVRRLIKRWALLPSSHPPALRLALFHSAFSPPCSIIPSPHTPASPAAPTPPVRAAIRLRYDFHRAIYNLGTVLYGLAEDTMKQAKSKTGVMPDRTTHPANEVYSQSAVYIAAAHALKADYPIYCQSAVYIAAAHALKADYPVSDRSGERKGCMKKRAQLPLPYLKGGYLTVPPGGNSLAPHAEWLRLWFVLDHERLKEGKKPEPKQPHSNLTSRRNTANSQTSVTASIVPKPEPAPPTAAAPAAPANAGTAGSAAATSDGGRWSSDAMGGRPNLSSSVEDAVSALPPPPIQVDIGQIVSVEACADLSLPAGGGIVLDTVDGPFYMVADDWDSMDAWVDAIRLVYTIYVRGKSEDLAAVLAA